MKLLSASQQFLPTPEVGGRVFPINTNCPAPSPSSLQLTSPDDSRNKQNYNTYSERERKTPLVGCVPFGPAQTFLGSVTEVLMLSDKYCACSTEIKRKQYIVVFSLLRNRDGLHMQKLFALCFLANHSNFSVKSYLYG